MRSTGRGVARAVVVVVVMAAGVWLAAANQQTSATKPASQSADALLGAALHQEEVVGQLEAAIATYRQVLKASDATREQQARAQFRIGACYERLGNAEARKAYEEVVRTYADQAGLAAQARSRLAALTSGEATRKADPPGAANVVRRVQVDGGDVQRDECLAGRHRGVTEDPSLVVLVRYTGNVVGRRPVPARLRR